MINVGTDELRFNDTENVFTLFVNSRSLLHIVHIATNFLCCDLPLKAINWRDLEIYSDYVKPRIHWFNQLLEFESRKRIHESVLPTRVCDASI